MQPDHAPPDHDPALRQRLRQSLQASAGATAATQALEQRVLAQWRQRHGQADGAPLLLASGGSGMLGLTAQRQRWARALIALVLGLAVLAWWMRPDPTLAELLQPDVLSLMSMGEF